jgi:preprotein translocase SecE subunit
VAWSQLNWFARLKQFIVEVWAELQKTTWPSMREVRGTTVVVIVTVFICALYLYVVDKFLETGMTRLLQAFGR